MDPGRATGQKVACSLVPGAAAKLLHLDTGPHSTQNAGAVLESSMMTDQSRAAA
jgi:hypothetical protein